MIDVRDAHLLEFNKFAVFVSPIEICKQSTKNNSPRLTKTKKRYFLLKTLKCNQRLNESYWYHPENNEKKQENADD